MFLIKHYGKSVVPNHLHCSSLRFGGNVNLFVARGAVAQDEEQERD